MKPYRLYPSKGNVAFETTRKDGTTRSASESDHERDERAREQKERQVTVKASTRKTAEREAPPRSTARSLSDVIIGGEKDMKTDGAVGVGSAMSLDSLRIRDRLAPGTIIVDFDLSAAGSCTLSAGVIQFVLLLDRAESSHGVLIPIIDVKDPKGEGRWTLHYCTRFQVSNSVRKIRVGWKGPDGSIVHCKVGTSPATDFATIKYRLSLKE